MINYILRSLIYFQSFLWLFVLFENRLLFFIYDREIPIFFYYFGFCAYLYVLINDVSFGVYTSFLIGFYILMVLLCYSIFSIGFFSKDALALAFLIVFINSYYWESMLHLNAIIFNGLNFNQIIQAFHLLPAYFLVKRIKFNNPRRVLKLLLYGLMISAFNVSIITLGWRHIINPLTRVSTLGILITIVIEEIKKEKGFLDIKEVVT